MSSIRRFSALAGIALALAPLSLAAKVQENTPAKQKPTTAETLKGLGEKGQDKKEGKGQAIGRINPGGTFKETREKIDETLQAGKDAVRDVENVNQKPAPARPGSEPAKEAEKKAPGDSEVPATDRSVQAGEKAKADVAGGANPRALANRLAAAVKVHEVRFARLDGLHAHFTEAGDTAKVARVQALRTREEERYQAELATFRSALGDETYKTVLAGLRINRKGNGAAKGKPDPALKRDLPAPESTEKTPKERGAPEPVSRKKEGG